MSESQFNFDTIPVEIVKKIATEFPSEPALDPTISEPELPPSMFNSLPISQAVPVAPVPYERPTPPEGKEWQQLADLASKETDPQKLIELVQQLCDALETHESTRKNRISPQRTA
jgi:hypothetical protein